jgi:hypothetical protein
MSGFQGLCDFVNHSFVCLFVWWGVCLFVCLVRKAGEIRTLPKTSLPVAVLRVAKGGSLKNSQ